MKYFHMITIIRSVWILLNLTEKNHGISQHEFMEKKQVLYSDLSNICFHLLGEHIENVHIRQRVIENLVAMET